MSDLAPQELQALVQPQPQATASPEEIRRQVEQEQALADAQKKAVELQDTIRKLNEEKKAIEGEKGGAVSTVTQLRSQLATLQSSHHNVTSELSVLQVRIDAVEREKRELLDEVDRIQQRLSRSTQEMYTLRAQKTDSAQKIAHLDVEVSELRMSAESAKFNEERSVQALQGARNEIVNISKAAADVEERFGKYRAEKHSELSQLQVEHDGLISRLTSAENSYRAIQRNYNDLSQRLADAHSNIATLTTAAAAKKASTSLEFSRLLEENRVLEKRGDDARTVISEREAELERMADAYAEKEREWAEKYKKEERIRREAEKRSEDLKLVVERLAMAGGAGNDISPAASLANGMRQGGKTYTQFYTDYTIMEGKYRAAENENSRLTTLLDEISQDIAEKKPLLDEQQAERDLAVERANALAGELATVMAARDAHDAKVKALTASSTHYEEEVASLKSTTDDLSRQVQSLLRQIAIRDDPLLANEGLDAPNPSEGDIITDHLVEFKSIRGLQEQNQKLLKLTRGLMAKLDTREINRATADYDDMDTSASLDQATETIKRLHTQLLEAQKKINEATRDRDFFSKLLAKGEGLRWTPSSAAASGSGGPLEENPHQETITTLQGEIELLKTRAEGEIREAKEEARAKAQQAGIADVEKAKIEAKVTLLEEQHRLLNDANTLQKTEYNNLDQQYRQLQGAISQANNERRVALEQVASRQAEADRLRNEAANLRAEKEQWKGTESRLQADFRTVQTERAKLQQLIDNLNNVNAETEKSRGEERQRLEKRIDDLEREATALRTQVEKAREATQAAEKRVENFDARLESATTAVRAEKDAAESLAESRSKEITTLQAEVEKLKADSENKYRIGMNWKNRATQVTEERNKDRDANTEALAAKEKEKEALQAEEETLKGKIAELEKKVADSERGNHTKDMTVQRLQSELAKAQTQPSHGATAPAPADESALNAVKAEKEALQQRLSEVEKELATAKAATRSAPPASTPATATATATAPSESTSEPAALSDTERSELQAKVKELEEARAAQDQKYEEDVRKVNRVNGNLSRDKQNLNQRLAELQSAKTEADAKIAELEKEITELKGKLESAAATASQGPAPAEGPGGLSQSDVDEAVKQAVSALEAELAAAKSTTAGEAQADTDTSASGALEELRKSETDLKGQVVELTAKVKNSERLLKTAEISRKTLERSKNTLEARLAALEGTAPTAAAPGVPLTPASTQVQVPIPIPSPSAPPAGPSTPTTAAAAAAPARGGAVRGRGRGGTAIRGARGGGVAGKPGANPILSAVNATLSQAQPTAPTPTPISPLQGTKRTLPEEGEISENTPAPAAATAVAGGESILARIQGTAGQGARVLKRPRGAAPKGAGAGRRPSGQGGQGSAGDAGGEGAS